MRKNNVLNITSASITLSTILKWKRLISLCLVFHIKSILWSSFLPSFFPIYILSHNHEMVLNKVGGGMLEPEGCEGPMHGAGGVDYQHGGGRGRGGRSDFTQEVSAQQVQEAFVPASRDRPQNPGKGQCGVSQTPLELSNQHYYLPNGATWNYALPDRRKWQGCGNISVIPTPNTA